MSDASIEHELIRQASCLVDLQVIDSEVEHFGENTRVKITTREAPEIIESCALGSMFPFGVQLFRDTRHRGVCDVNVIANDSWTAADLVQQLCFQRGRIEFDADNLRGRMMVTVVEAHADGRTTLEESTYGLLLESSSHGLSHHERRRPPGRSLSQ